MSEWTTTDLWLAVVASGIYHGINPSMGWPLAVSAVVGNKRLHIDLDQRAAAVRRHSFFKIARVAASAGI